MVGHHNWVRLALLLGTDGCAGDDDTRRDKFARLQRNCAVAVVDLRRISSVN